VFVLIIIDIIQSFVQYILNAEYCCTTQSVQCINTKYHYMLKGRLCVFNVLIFNIRNRTPCRWCTTRQHKSHFCSHKSL